MSHFRRLPLRRIGIELVVSPYFTGETPETDACLCCRTMATLGQDDQKDPKNGGTITLCCLIQGTLLEAEISKSGKHAMHMGTITRTAKAAAINTLESGICAGTTIMTLDGEIPVEHLSVGNRIITRDSGMSIIKAIVSRDVKVQPVRIKAGSLGHTRPDRDMIVSPGTRIHIRDWRAEALFGAAAATVEATRLIDGEFLAELPARDLKVYDLIFDREHILYADGVEIVSAVV